MELRKIIREQLENLMEGTCDIWYHGTPDVRELEKEGGFKSKVFEVEYVPDPKAFYELQNKLRMERETNGTSNDYFRLLDKVGDLKEKFKLKKPVFLTDEYSVAKTYADPFRAFDYQNSKEKVLKVCVSPGQSVKIYASGERFRFIDVASVKKGFVAAGIDQEEFDQTLSKFNFFLRKKGNIKTDIIAAIGAYYNFDYIDVIGVLDSYHGGSKKSTVRMALNTNLLSVEEGLNEELNEACRDCPHQNGGGGSEFPDWNEVNPFYRGAYPPTVGYEGQPGPGYGLKEEETISTTLYPVKKLWNRYKNSSWRMNGQKVTLNMIVNGKGDPTNENVKTIMYWADKFSKEGISSNNYLILKNDGTDELLDGYHRLAAAAMVDLKEVPVIFKPDNMMQLEIDGFTSNQRNSYPMGQMREFPKAGDFDEFGNKII